MRFCKGATRWVLLIGSVAIKVPRLRPGRWFLRFFFWGSRGKIKERLEGRFRRSFLDAVWNYVGSGIIANIQERTCTQIMPQLKIAPTLFSFFGLINIQVRGRPIRESDLSECPFRDMLALHPKFKDLNSIRNFAWINGELYLVDAGEERDGENFFDTLVALYGMEAYPSVVYAR